MVKSIYQIYVLERTSANSQNQSIYSLIPAPKSPREFLTEEHAETWISDLGESNASYVILHVLKKTQ